MTTIVIKSKSKAAKLMIDYLKTQSYAKVIETNEPNDETKKAIAEARAGKTTKFKDYDDYIAKTR